MTSGYGTGSQGNVLVIGSVLLHPKDTTYLDTRITSASLRHTFVHEYVHHLDHMRRGKLPDRHAMRAAHAGDIAGYLRTPEEFNAWYQETAQAAEDSIAGKIKVIERFRSVGKDALVVKVVAALHRDVASFPAFLKFVEKHNEAGDTLAVLKGSKWERKWLKRMHTLYRGLKPKVMSMSAGSK